MWISESTKTTSVCDRTRKRRRKLDDNKYALIWTSGGNSDRVYGEEPVRQGETD